MRTSLACLTAGALSVTALLLACQGQGAPSPAPRGAPSAPPPSAPAVPPLDLEGPALDLLASQALLHLHQAGFLLPFGAEGFRKYTSEYGSPWRALATLEDRAGRALSATAATLRFPWDGEPGAATLVVRVHGASAGRKLSLRLNGRPVKNTKLDAGWTAVTVAVPAGMLAKGENTLALAVGKRGALFHSVELIPGEASPAADEPWPPPSPVAQVRAGARQAQALTGFPRLALPTEIPENGWLVVEPAALAGPVRFEIAATPEGQPVKVLFDATLQPGESRPTRLSLAELSGKLVALSFTVREGRAADAAWLAPRIVLARAATRPRPAPAQNLIVFVADALRADKLPMYGETRVRTPNLAKAAAEHGVTFTSTQAASPSSPPSHASIQSGCVPRRHGILGDKSKVSPDTPMVSAILAKAGLATGFFGDAGFAMNRLKPASRWTEFHQPSQEGKGGDCSALVREILAFVDRQAGKRFFVSAVAMEAHTAYLYHPGVTEHYYDGPFDEAIGKRPDGVQLTAIVSGKLKMTPERWAQLKGLYDGEVEHLDGCFGALGKGLAERGLLESTPIVLLADHGEGFFEHGSMGHAYGQYAELTNVPLVVFAPGLGRGQKIATVVSHVDVVPTVLDLLGLPADERVQGESLLPMILREGPWVPRVAASEYGRSYSLRSRALHYLVDYGGKESLFDLSVDPTEQHDLTAKRPLALRYFRDLAGLYLAHRAAWRAPTWGTLNNHRAGFAGGQAP